MKVYISNQIKNLISLVNEKAKYQKVLMLHDNSVSNLDINNLFYSIKELCVFNKMELNNVDEKEFYNGYKMLIFYCDASNLINFNLNREEFINIYIPTTRFIFPFFSNNLTLLTKNSFLLLNSSVPDINFISCLYFNNFINYSHSLLNFQAVEFNEFDEQELNMTSILNVINNIKQPLFFTDLEICKNTKLNANDLCLLHLILINAFIAFITSIKNNQLGLIDIYKVAKENFNLIDKCYSIFFNETFYNSVILNFNCLYNATIKTKNQILKLLALNNDIPSKNVNIIIDKVKNYLKTSNCKLSFLYFFNVFGS